MAFTEPVADFPFEGFLVRVAFEGAFFAFGAAFLDETALAGFLTPEDVEVAFRGLVACLRVAAFFGAAFFVDLVLEFTSFAVFRVDLAAGLAATLRDDVTFFVDLRTVM